MHLRTVGQEAMRKLFSLNYYYGTTCVNRNIGKKGRQKPLTVQMVSETVQVEIIDTDNGALRQLILPRSTAIRSRIWI